MALDRSEATPLHLQLYDEILGLIQDGIYPVGQRLPTETTLAAEFGVNRLTIRQALDQLARTGHVIARQGVGTFVSERPTTIDVEMTTESWDSLYEHLVTVPESIGRSFTEELLSVADIEAPSETAQHLGDGTVTQIETLSTVDGDLLIHSYYWTRSASSIAEIEKLGSDQIGVGFMQAVVGTETYYSWRAFEAEAATRLIAQHLDIPLGAPVLVRSGLNCDSDGSPRLFVRRSVPAGRMRFRIRPHPRPFE